MLNVTSSLPQALASVSAAPLVTHASSGIVAGHTQGCREAPAGRVDQPQDRARTPPIR